MTSPYNYTQDGLKSSFKSPQVARHRVKKTKTRAMASTNCHASLPKHVPHKRLPETWGKPRLSYPHSIRCHKQANLKYWLSHSGRGMEDAYRLCALFSFLAGLTVSRPLVTWVLRNRICPQISNLFATCKAENHFFLGWTQSKLVNCLWCNNWKFIKWITIKESAI